MEIYEITPKIKIVCRFGDSRNGFNHFATLFINGQEVEETKCHYINRTWERYTYQSVMQKLIDKTSALTPDEKELCLKFLEEGDGRDLKALGNIAMVASLGDIFGSTIQEKNSWKKRMLKAGLGDGLSLPEDFDNLDEKEKARRLDGAIKQLQ